MRHAPRLAMLAAVGLLANTVLAPSVVAQSREVRVTIFHDTHLHGNLEGPGGITLGHYVGLINQIRAELPAPGYSLWVGNGDDIAPSLMSSVFRGEHMIESLNAAGLDVDTFGNHDFDFGPDHLRGLIARSRFPWVSANVRDAATGDVFGAEVGARRWLVKEVGGIRFGFTGLAPVETPTISSPGPGLVFLDPIDAMREIMPRVRADGAQVVVVLSHLSDLDTERVVSAVDGIDVAVGRHVGIDLDSPRVVNNAIVSRRGEELRRLGQLDLFIRDGRIVGHEYTAHRVTADGPVEPALTDILESYKLALSAELEIEVGETSTALEATRAAVRGRESTAGNFVADALRAWAGTDIALQNGGGIRGERIFQPGMLRKRDIQEMLPFANYGVILRLSGADIVAALENGVSRVEQLDGRFPQVSRLAFSYDPGATPGSRVTEVWVGAEPIDGEAVYTLATNDFMANGGDGYTMLQAAEVVVPAAGGPLLTNLVIDYLEAQGVVSPSLEGRIRTTS